jgi:5-(carboxyamino)imidazole ribonucleotide mutase
MLPKRKQRLYVSIVVGSKSDGEVAKRAVEVLDDLGIMYEVKVLSAHRNPKELEKYIEKTPAVLFIAIAGLAAHLPGFIASRTKKPVIGVPVSAKLGGLDALLSITQMPSGVPVASVGIDNAKNAALLAARILAVSDKKLAEKMERMS